MKKMLILLPALLVIVFIILSVIDRSDYVVERKMWNIQHRISTLSQKSKTVPVKELEGLEVRCQNMIQEYPQSHLLSQMYMQLAEIYVITKDYDKARTGYALVLEKFPQQLTICARALVAIGMTCLAQKKGDEALLFYQAFIKNHPNSPLNDGLKNAIVYLQDHK